MQNTGLLNEKQILNTLAGQRFRELSPFWQETITKIFGEVDENQIIIARYIPNYVGCKTDIELQVGTKEVNISIKSGKWPSMHQERISYFLDFLKEEGISEETRNFIAFYLYADGTVDGSGKEKIPTEIIKANYMDRILAANKEMNNKEFIRKMLYRSVVKGRKEKRKEIHYVYYGDCNQGILISKEDLLNYIPNKKTSHYKCLHCGPLIFINKDKQLNRERRKDDYNYIQIKWPTMIWDILKLEKFKH